MKILVTTTSFQDTPGKHHDLLNSLGWEIDYLRGPLGKEKLKNIVSIYDGILCGDDEYSDKVIERGAQGRLRALSKYGVGLDRIDLISAKKHGVIVTNVPGVNQVAVAEHALALLFTYQKNIHLQYNSVQNKNWERLTGHVITGMTLGIIGMGSVGKELAKKAVGLGLNVVANDIKKEDTFYTQNNKVKYVENVDQIYEACDIISLHLPHNKFTDEIINEDVLFNKIKNSPILINTSRGRLINTEAVIRALKKKKLTAYLSDVLSEEPISKDEKLVGIPRVIITPHVGSRTFESVEKQGIQAINNLVDSLNKSNC